MLMRQKPEAVLPPIAREHSALSTVPFVPVTSAAFTLFTLFMIPDPATTPIKPARQVAFGLVIAAIYGLLFVAHVVFGLFIALCLSSAGRGIGLYIIAAMK